MPSIIPEGYAAYKVVRVLRGGEYISLSGHTERSWPIIYTPEREITPSTMPLNIPTKWMFIFTDYEHALKYYQDYDLCNQGDFQIWRIRVFEQHLPTPNLILAPWQLSIFGEAYWNNWDTPGGLRYLKEQGIYLVEPPDGTRLCSRLKLEERVYG